MTDRDVDDFLNLLESGESKNAATLLQVLQPWSAALFPFFLCDLTQGERVACTYCSDG